MPRPDASQKLEPYRQMMGERPDHEIAALAEVSISTVGKHRRRMGIGPYQGNKFVKGLVGVPASNATEEQRTAAPSGTAASTRSSTTSTPRRRRRSKLDPWLHLVGVLTDREVSERAGISADGVRMYRHRHGIPAANGRGRRPATTTWPVATEMKAYAVIIESGEASEEYVIVSGDIVSAASRAFGIIRGRDEAARVTSVRYLAQTLNTI